MKLKMKKSDGSSWSNIKVDELIGKAPFDVISDSFELAIGGVYDDNDKLIMVMSNKQEGLDMYRNRDDVLCLLSHELEALLGENRVNIVLETFPDSDFIEVKTCYEER